MTRRLLAVLALLGLALAGRQFFTRRVAAAASLGPPFIEFESGPVRPLALSPDGNTLFAADTPNGTLEIFDLSSGTPTWKASVRVGLEPVAVAARNNTEVWVTNLLSDS